MQLNVEWDPVKAASNPRVARQKLKEVNMRKEYDFSKAKRGPVVKTKGKTRITIYLDDDVIDAYRARGDELGRGYQTLINEALRTSLGNTVKPVDAKTLRRILREELKKAG